MKAYLINALERKITPIEYEYKTMKQYLPGGICIGATFENGDVLYVDDEALLRKAEKAFRIRQRPDGQPMMSDGILTGMDSYDGKEEKTLPPRMSIAQLEKEIEWLTVEEALNWFRQHAFEPSVVIKFGDRETVAAHWFDILHNLYGEEGGYDPSKIKW